MKKRGNSSLHYHYLFNFFTFPALLNWLFIPFFSAPKKGNQIDVLHQRYPREEAMMMVENHQLTHELETLNEGTNPPCGQHDRGLRRKIFQS